MPAIVKIYRYLAAEHALKTLRERRLHVSRIKDLNDPFEWRVGSVADVEHHATVGREVLDAYIDRVNDRFGIISHSAELADPVNWSHYADKHKGIVLQFDHFLVEALQAISYSHALPTFDVTQFLATGSDQSYTLAVLKQSLGRKSPSWAYEKEYRVHLELNEDCVKEGDKYFKAIPDDFLKQVILGVNCKTSQSDVELALAAGGFTDVKIVPARMSETSYEIICD